MVLYVVNVCTVDSDMTNGSAASEKSLPSVRSAPSLQQVTSDSVSDVTTSASRQDLLFVFDV